MCSLAGVGIGFGVRVSASSKPFARQICRDTVEFVSIEDDTLRVQLSRLLFLADGQTDTF